MAEQARETQKRMSLGNYGIVVREAVGTQRLDVGKEFRVSAGSTEFDVVIEFGKLFEGMAGSIVPIEQRWNEYQNGDVKVLTNHPSPSFSHAAQLCCKTITEIAKFSSPQDPIGVKSYGGTVESLTQMEQLESDGVLRGATPIVALRAGLPMTKALGYKEDKMILLDAKRLNGLDDPNKLALGLRFVGDKKEIMHKIQQANGNFVNADPALATGSTQLGILLWLLSNEVQVNNFTALSIGAAQQGLELLSKSVNQLREQGSSISSFNAITADIHPELTEGEHPYYIKTKNGDFAVGDGGDFLDLLLPGDIRKRWAEKVMTHHISELEAISSLIKWNLLLKVGEDVDLPLMVKIQQQLEESGKNILVGTIFKKEEMIS